MRITPQDFEALKQGMIATLSAHNLHPYMVNSPGRAWEVFHKAWNEGCVDGNALYERYCDSHLETAFRRIFK